MRFKIIARGKIISPTPANMLLAILGLLLVTLVFYFGLPRSLYCYYRQYKLLRSIPAPDTYTEHWLLGHIPDLYKFDEALLLDAVKQMNKPTNKDLCLLKIWLGPVPAIAVHHPKVLPKLLKEPKSEIVYRMLKPWLGEGLLISQGDKWQRNRRLLNAGFRSDVLRGYIPVFDNCVSVLLTKWSKSAQKGEPVKIFEAINTMLLDIILRCGFSFESGCQIAKLPYTVACCELIELCTNRIMNPLYLIDWLYWLTPHGRKTKKLCNIVHEQSEKILAERKLSLEHAKKGKARKYLDFLDILLMAKDENGKGMTDLEIRTEVDTLMFGGHDTTTSGLSWALYCLSKYPEHQDKVREEVQSVLMGKEHLEYDDLKELKYTTWCIKEAMRLYPAVVYISRRTTEEIELDNHLIPEGITVGIQLFLLHRNANIWENPNEYDPLRFHPVNMDKHGPYDYIPFSAGYRSCFGQSFAMLTMKLAVGMIVNRFSMKLDESHKVEMIPRAVLKTKNDAQVYLKDLTVDL